MAATPPAAAGPSPAAPPERGPAPPVTAPPHRGRTHRILAAAGPRWRHFWHEYTRMRTAIYFLIAIALIVLIGSFVPQQDTSATQKVTEFLAEHHNLDAIASTFGLPLTQVFVAPLFLALLGSLYIALGWCVLRRGRALVMRTVRRRPRTAQYWGEWGSWLFHSAFFVLLIAVVWGKATGFQAVAAITEGQTFTEGRVGEDLLHEGVLFDGNHSGYELRLNSFHATYAGDGEAKDFVSNVTVFDGGREVETKDIRVNDFLGYRDVDFYQQDYGWAPHVVVTNPAGKVVYDDYPQFFSAPGSAGKNVQAGVLKVPDFGYTVPGTNTALQLGAEMAVFPDARTIAGLDANGNLAVDDVTYAPGGQEARNPVLQVQLFFGDLGLNSGQTQDVFSLDTSHMQPFFTDRRALPVVLGKSITLGLPDAKGNPQPFTVTFKDLKQYSLFLVKKDNGVPVVYLGFFLMMLGLIVKLYVRPLAERRRASRVVVGHRVDTVPPPRPEEDAPVPAGVAPPDVGAGDSA